MAFQKWQTPYEGLGKRAIEILHLLGQGMSDREIAEQLIVSVNTVKWYNRQIYSILAVGNRTQAIARARELELLSKDDGIAPSFRIVHRLPQHNLPVETTEFIGRRHAMEAIKRLLDAAHLLTLVGPPGTGKTRLALRTAWELADTFQDGVYFVSLASISDPMLVINAIASAVGMNETPGRPFIEMLKTMLRTSQIMLILDNFEHLLSAATQVSELLSAAPNLKVLATSREPLHLYGEQQYAVPPLGLPDSDQLDPIELIDCESTALFMQRAQAVRSDFELTVENAADVAEICVRLEGLPLAIELAAARIKLLTPQTLLTRLMSRLDTLTGGAQDIPARQQTLRSTIEWSYNLLTEGEKLLFARLGVFQGGCSLDAVEEVCEKALPMDVFDGLSSLVDKSLVQQKEVLAGEPRFVMLETIHEYAWECLKSSDEAQARCRQHAEYFARLAERAEPQLRQASFTYWMERLGAEEENFRVALEWSLGGADVELGLRLVASLRDFWVMSGRFTEGQRWTQRALPEAGSVPPHLQGRILIAAGAVLYISSQPVLQKHLFEEAIELARKFNDKLNLAWALTFLGATCIRSVIDYEEGLSATKEGLKIFQDLGNKPGIVLTLNLIGELRRIQGDDERAQVAYEECLLLASETGEIRREAMMLCNLGLIAMHRADINEAIQLFRKALLKSYQLLHDKRLIVSAVLLLADAIAASGELEGAARLFGAADALFKPAGVGLSPNDRPDHERVLATVREQLDDKTFQVCWNEGQALTLEQAVAHALEFAES
jgi:predicted ATPase/DNA-binding CsgD family transcriptional regulator